MEIRFDTYYTYAQLTERLAWLAARHPQIMQVGALGKSHEGREIPLVILTNRATGPDTEKPAFWLDANIHATELTASMAALYFVVKLAEAYGNDPKITRILDEQAIYVVPRLNPDGAEMALADHPRYIRSGTRPYPFEDKRDGLHAEDIDGDGRILQMRIPDPTGDWKVSDRDPRLMVKRGPDEEGGAYYRLFPEGLIENYDGHIITMASPLQGLDFNRNFPGAWRPEGEQRGAGDFPGSEPEIRAVIEFMAAHPNIFGALTFHTYSRVILRPFGTKSDDEMDTDDKWVFEAIGERGTALTGYPCVSVFHHFRYHPKEVITGVFDDWLYEHKGIFAYTVELWDLTTAAGVVEKNSDKKFMDWFRKHPVEDDYKILDYVNQHAPDGLVPWYRFDHPQLGAVELGGWKTLYTWRNPPHALLEAEIAPASAFAVAFASLAPRLAWREVVLTPVGDDTYHLLVVVENLGFLPTSGSNQAKKLKAVRPLRLELTLPEGAALVSGKLKQEIGYLEGRSNKLEVSYAGESPTDNRGKAEWLIRAPQGGPLALAAIAERGGTIRRTIALGEA
jgi:murein tripeptide amidase MpaA